MNIYADTNFFTNTLLELPFSGDAERLTISLRETGTVLPVPFLLKMEVISALQRLVFESRTGSQPLRVTAEMALLAEAAFLDQVDDRFLINA